MISRVEQLNVRTGLQPLSLFKSVFLSIFLNYKKHYFFFLRRGESLGNNPVFHLNDLESESVSLIVLLDSVTNPMDYNPPGSSAHGISLERILQWVALPFSRGSFQLRD